MTTKLESALALAKLGFHVFPLVPGSKLPLIDAWQRKATRDEARIVSWWTDPVLGLEQDFNVGISTSHFADDQALWVIDVDNKGSKRGDDELLRMELGGYDIPATFEQSTPTGGRHLVYLVDEAVRQGANRIAPGLDTRSHGGYIVGAGSTIDGRGYAVRGDCTLPARAPSWYRQFAGDRVDTGRGESVAPEGVIDQDAAVIRVVDYLSHSAPLAVQGNGGDATTFAVACKVKDFGVDEAMALYLLGAHWNGRCSPPWLHDELETKVKNAYRYGNEAVGASAPEVEFNSVVHETGVSTDGGQAGSVDKPEPPLRQINKDHALIYLEGSHFILHETIDEKGRPHRVFLTEASFKRKFSPWTTQRATKGKPLTWAEEWLDWKDRREYKGLCFAPEREPRNGYYNLWRGFTCQPVAYADASPEAQRGFDAWLEHLRENVCHGNDELATWLLTYFAHSVQRPWERPLTTIVFRGTKGVGKNALMDRLGQLFGASHYLVAHDGRYLTSNFNGHLDSCIWLILDEAFWSGDKTAEGKLKGLTTAPEMMIERKGKEPYMIDNLVRIGVIGNEDWLVPASADERRYAVFDVGEGRKQDAKFFEQMRINMDDRGGKNVLLAFLKNYDLTRANVNIAPKTNALLDQKHASLEPFEQWWLDCLMAGYLLGGDFGGAWPEKVETDRFRQAFRRYATDRNVRARIPNDLSLGHMIKKCAPGVKKKRERQGNDLPYVYTLPTLDVARAEWARFIGHEMVWE